jgi:hypothetical protein
MLKGATMLEEGDVVQAATNVNIRVAPGLKGQLVGVLQRGEKRGLRMGPYSTDTLTWWKIDEGWVAERDQAGTILLMRSAFDNLFERCMDFVFRWEGGLSMISNDPGNWTGGAVGVGQLKGTKYGISAASYPTLDIQNLTKAQAMDIYRRNYWPIAQKYEWPMCLAVFDLAVNGGKGRAQQVLDKVGENFIAYMGERIYWYTTLGTWASFGKGWVRRCADLLTYAAKEK